MYMLILEYWSLYKSIKRKTIMHNTFPEITTYILLFSEYKINSKSSTIYFQKREQFPKLNNGKIIYFINEYGCITQEFLY